MRECTKENCSLCGGRHSEIERGDTLYKMSDWDGGIEFEYIKPIRYCPLCGRELPEE